MKKLVGKLVFLAVIAGAILGLIALFSVILPDSFREEIKRILEIVLS